ncbi:uncharacterized protein LOC114452313 [Parambassis ranga]|uniref:Uncharacterized protein LOC114452313 n=1 Tax=Parambassis ranga TaxID=210632 RepID=A0A6P7KIZ8_9TELE|nr:uncharacterized protein LOC114452313 [Parambassis ranga]
MVDRAVALEALGATCNATITSESYGVAADAVLGATVGLVCGGGLLGFGSALGGIPLLSINNFISTVLDGEQTCSVSQYNSTRIQDVLRGVASAANPSRLMFSGASTFRNFVINESKFFDPDFDYDFRGETDTEIYYRGGEKYTRPCGWFRFALKVLNKYEDNTWLGNQGRTTESVPGEWPVSYHGTSAKNAKGIIKTNYQAGPREKFGRGVYSTPVLSEAEGYAKQFTSKTNGKTYKVVLQNRINPAHREKHNNDIYWLVPIEDGMTPEDEKQKVQQTIRPYGLLLKEV